MQAVQFLFSCNLSLMGQSEIISNGEKDTWDNIMVCAHDTSVSARVTFIWPVLLYEANYTNLPDKIQLKISDYMCTA